MPDSETEVNNKHEKTSSEKSDRKEIDNKLLNNSAEKAIEQYRKVRENSGRDLTEKEMAEIDKECEIIKNREIITQDTEHKPV